MSVLSDGDSGGDEDSTCYVIAPHLLIFNLIQHRYGITGMPVIWARNLRGAARLALRDREAFGVRRARIFTLAGEWQPEFDGREAA